MPSIRHFALSAFCLAAGLPAWAADAPAPAAKAEPRAALLERSTEQAQDLARTLPAEQQQQLEASGDNFLALWRPANAPDGEGVVIIVPGAGESANWPDVVGPMRDRLPDVKWASLSLTLPDLLSDAIQPRGADTQPAPAKAGSSSTPPDANAPVEAATAAGSENSASTGGDSTNDQLQTDAERIFARIDAGIAFAQQQKARSIVLLGHGTGAYWAARYLSERQATRAQKLVMVEARTPGSAPQGLDALAPVLKIPVADFFYPNSPALVSAAKARLQASKRQKSGAYTQVEMTAMPGNRDAQEQMFRRVRGWLSPSQDQ
ncbi:alpha/beta hydrolase family protein [Pseudomonas sp. KNUC1026]|uniref:alpha/beta hydrolase family protein n=1 Tax=Pseudomonas sp. KNUC1026 TaxID=2893890 RepID=UPI001F2EEDB4|nr:alpha/beta hydrolase family protein [Pseudomonas sp. KNUC1026]UFH49830.1 alpha/beta hydrolase family protein [Pseudomonas sp. KNUC1026]